MNARSERGREEEMKGGRDGRLCKRGNLICCCCGNARYERGKGGKEAEEGERARIGSSVRDWKRGRWGSERRMRWRGKRRGRKS